MTGKPVIACNCFAIDSAGSAPYRIFRTDARGIGTKAVTSVDINRLISPANKDAGVLIPSYLSRCTIRLAAPMWPNAATALTPEANNTLPPGRSSAAQVEHKGRPAQV